MYKQETVNISKKKLDALKEDKEALEETLEILSDPKLVKDIRKSLKDADAGRTISYEKIKKKCGL